MLNLDNKQYDLNTLFSFEVLKEILLKLARGQINLEEKVQNIINVYQNKENAEKEKYVNISETDDNNIDVSKDLLNDEEEKSKLSGIIENKEINQSKNPQQTEINNPPKNNFDSEFKEKDSNKENNENKNSSENNKEEYKDDNKKSSDNYKEEEKKENNENNNSSEKSKEEENKDNNKNEVKVNDEYEYENKTEKDKEENEEIMKNEIKANDESETKLEKDKEENKYTNNEEKESEVQEKKDISNKDEISQSKRNSEKENNKVHTNGKSNDLIKNILRAIKENKERIASLEKELLKEKERNKKDFKSHEQNNYNDFDSLRKKLNELSLKLAEYDSKIENCEIMCSNLDVMNMIKDSGDGKIDAAKVMVKSLEEKIFKKFELIDEKNKNEKSDSININSKIDLIFDKINRDRQNIEKLYNITGENKEAIDQIKKDLKEKTNEIRKITDEEKSTSKKLDDAKKSLNKKIKELSEKLNSEIEELKNKIDNGSLFKLGLNNESPVDKEVIDDINLKINDLRKRYNELDSSFKFHLANNKADYLDIEVQKMKANLDKKITLDDLKELYNLHLGDLDEINDSKNKISVLYEQVKRALSSIQSLSSKLENLTTNVSLIQSIQSSGNNNNTAVPTQGIIDFSKFVDSQKLTDTVKPLIKEMQKMFQEVYSLRREMDDIQNLNKDTIKQESLDKLEEKINEKINELKNIIHKKYLEKTEHYKAVKHLEAQIKVQVEENKKDSESWIMAKRPLKCFNCATCESNIKNMSPSNDYLPWNKYPPGEKIYRMGQGFSHMLQMMTNEFVKNVEKNANELQKENEQSHKSLNLNTINDNGRVNTNFINNEKTLIGLSINNRHHQVEDPQQTVSNIRKSGKVRLPLMTKFMKNKKPKNSNDVPVSDEEGDNNNDFFDKFKILGSPKIMKIIKKKNSVSKSVAISDLNDKNFITDNYTQSEDIKDNFGQSRNSKN